MGGLLEMDLFTKYVHDFSEFYGIPEIF